MDCVPSICSLRKEVPLLLSTVIIWYFLFKIDYKMETWLTVIIEITTIDEKFNFILVQSQPCEWMLFFSLFKILLEAQDMAVRDHNVEFRSNLYIGKIFYIFNIGKCLLIVMWSSLSNSVDIWLLTTGFASENC